MSKEEILKDLPYAYDGMLGKEVPLNERMYMFKDAIEAMDIYAKQECIAFAEFLRNYFEPVKDGWFCDTENNVGIEVWSEDNSKVYSTEQLYEIFKTNQP